MIEELRELIARHCITVAGKSERLASLLNALEDSHGKPAEIVDAAIALTHEIRGSAGSIGFGDVFATATALEGYLKTLRGIRSRAPADAVEEVQSRLKALTETTSRLTPESSHLYYADVSAMIRQ